MQRVLLLIIFTLASYYGKGQEITPNAFYDWMGVDSDTVDYRWFKVPYIKVMNKLAVDSYEKYPQDPFAPYVFAYTVHAARYLKIDQITRSLIDSILSRVKEFEERTKLKDAFYYNSNSYCYNNIYFMYMSINELEAARQVLQSSEQSLEKAQAVAVPGTRLYNAILNKSIGLYTNKALILYKATHHLDSEIKKREATPVMINLLDKADSLGDIYLNQAKMDYPMAARLITVYINKYLIYGGYWPDSVKAVYNFERAKTLLSNYCFDKENLFCRNSESHIKSSRYWVLFARQKYSETITEGRSYYNYLLENDTKYLKIPASNSFRADVLFALTDSYLKIGKPDSAYYFGNLFLNDTLSTKDYSFMSEVASIMAELSLGKDVNKAKEFLQLSKECIRKSKNEQIRTKFIREGEINQLNQSFERIIEVQESIRRDEEFWMKIFKILFISVSCICFLLGGFLLKKLYSHKTEKL
jgi:hypothetical protein